MRTSAHFAASSGVSVNDTSSENSVAHTITRPNSRMYSPMIPDMNAIGANTTTSTSVIATAAPPISARPAMAASSGGLPISRWRVMFSMTTIESSTRMPIVSDSPMSESTSIVKPSIHTTKNVASSDAGIAIRTTSALRHTCRNSSSTIAVSTIPSPRFCSTPLIDCIVNSLSAPTSWKASAGYLPVRSLNAARMERVVLTVSLSESRATYTSTESRLPTVEMRRWST